MLQTKLESSKTSMLENCSPRAGSAAMRAISIIKTVDLARNVSSIRICKLREFAEKQILRASIN